MSLTLEQVKLLTMKRSKTKSLASRAPRKCPKSTTNLIKKSCLISKCPTMMAQAKWKKVSGSPRVTASKTGWSSYQWLKVAVATLATNRVISSQTLTARKPPNWGRPCTKSWKATSIQAHSQTLWTNTARINRLVLPFLKKRAKSQRTSMHLDSSSL